MTSMIAVNSGLHAVDDIEWDSCFLLHFDGDLSSTGFNGLSHALPSQWALPTVNEISRKLTVLVTIEVSCSTGPHLIPRWALAATCVCIVTKIAGFKVVTFVLWVDNDLVQ